ncbi:hypothetical protein SEUCBS140593_009104 [Sporothrix eucalyptigena]|uniref:GH16 domain-containing protein n=1 Tax=Sporothrix eucalyptigena TaxID=1812306 RepID=A0ABP0CS07_9PEZI
MAPSVARLASAVAIAAMSHPVRAVSQYVLEQTYDSSNFFQKFDFITTADLSNGFVKYVDDSSLAHTTPDNTILLKVDSTSHLDSTKVVGRKSVRLEGQDEFTKGLFVADFAYLPQPACGAWPA